MCTVKCNRRMKKEENKSIAACLATQCHHPQTNHNIPPYAGMKAGLHAFETDWLKPIIRGEVVAAKVSLKLVSYFLDGPGKGNKRNDDIGDS